MKQRIAILFGGYSGEYEVSEKSARFVERYTDRERYIPYLVEFSKRGVFVREENGEIPVSLEDLSYEKDGERFGFDLAFVAIHGSPGEDGKLQGYLDLIGMPYTTGGVLNTALTFDKGFTKELLRSEGMHTARYVKLQKDELGGAERALERIGIPCFVKPNQGGSSLGNSKVTEEKGLEAALEKAFAIDDEVLVEELLEGKELDCGVLRLNGEVTPLPSIEIVPSGDFFDYEAKYHSPDTKEITPARIPEAKEREIRSTAERIYDRLRCEGMVRVDFFLLDDGTLSVVEVNTVPGLSDASLFPQEAEAYGLDLEQMIGAVIEEGLKKGS